MIKQWIISVWRDRSGSALIETALVAPVAMMMCLGLIEFGNYMLLTQKIQNATMNVADLAAREDNITVDQLKDLLLSVDEVMKPFDFSSGGTVILTGVGAVTAGNPEVVWQYKSPQDFPVASQVGSVGQAAALDLNIIVQDNDSIVVAEVVYNYKKAYLGLIPDTAIHKFAYYRARVGDFL